MSRDGSVLVPLSRDGSMLVPVSRDGSVLVPVSRDGSVLVLVLRPCGTPLAASPRFAFSRPVILGGVTDNSVSDGSGQRVPGGMHLPVPRERRQHPGSLLCMPQAFRALCTREKLLASFGPFPVRLSTANTYSYRKGERGDRARPRGCRFPRSSLPFPRSSLRSRSGCAVPGVRGAPAEAAGPGPAGQRWVAPSCPPQPPPLAGLSLPCPPRHALLLRGQQLHRVGPPFPALRAPSLPHPGHQPRLQLWDRRWVWDGIGPGLGGSPQHQPPAPTAGSGSGVPFHWHGPGFSDVIFGRKVRTEP